MSELLRLLWLALLLAAPLAAQRRVILVDIDGVRQDTFELAYRGGWLPNIERILDSALWFEHASAVFPSVTMTGQASIFTGAYPAKHGIMGNQWFDRSTGREVDYMAVATMPCVFGYALFGGDCGGGLANRHLQAATLYEAAGAAGKTSLVVFNQYWKGATRALVPSIADALEFLRGDDIDYAVFDRKMMDRALEAVGDAGWPDLLTLYFAGADGVGHSLGVNGQFPYLCDTIDAQMGRLLEALEAADPAWRATTLFVITADHGRTDATPFPEDRSLEADISRALTRAGFDPSRARIASDGGMAHVYLRGSGPWSELPAAEDTAAATRGLAVDPALSEVLEAVLPRGSEALPPLVRNLFSPRSGDILLLLKPGHYFGNTGKGSHHGSIHDEDLWVPLILAQGGVSPGRSAEPVSTVEVAATIAAYLGIPIEGTEAALPVPMNDGRQ